MKKIEFNIPSGLIYLDGNSLGPLPKKATERVMRTLDDEWGGMLIKGWNEANWMAQPSVIGDRVGKLIGAPAGSTVMGDTLSIKVYQALASAINLNPARRVILSDNGNFPTDLYMAQGLLDTLDKNYELRIVDPEDVGAAITDEIAVLMLTHVDYRTGRMHDMKTITQKAHDKGVIVIWDLAHSAGAVELDIKGCKAEFAIGCTYKYLNGGPGAPAFIYVRPDLADKVRPALSGWLGHIQPFAFDLDYRPGHGIERMRVGTPPIIQLAALDAALDIWDEIDMAQIRARSLALSELFLREVEARCPQLTLISPRNPDDRGSQISFQFDDGYAVMRALIDRDVIGDFRAPDVMRFGFTPLYIDEDDVMKAVRILEEVMSSKAWDNEDYKTKAAVT